MRITTSTEDTGLSDSTYELVFGTDTESQDGNYTESIGDSVASLDFHRPDDVHSLADTEHTNDDESLAESDVYAQVNQDGEEEQHDTTVLDQAPAPPLGHVQDDTESDDEARSRSSLEYTKQLLSTPSIPTPEGSGIVERPTEPTGAVKTEHDTEGAQPQYTKWLAELYREAEDHLRYHVQNLERVVVPSLACILVAVLLAAFCLPSALNVAAPNTTTSLSTETPVLSATTNAPSSLASSSTQRVITTSSSPASLATTETNIPHDWLFASRKIELLMSKERGDYMIRIVPPIKHHGLSVVARRGDQSVDMDITRIEEGVILKFPYEESHGTVNVELVNTCRPKFRQLIEIPFGDRGVVEEAVHMAKHLGQGISQCVPVAAQEAEQRLHEAKQSTIKVLDNLKVTSDTLAKSLIAKFRETHLSLGYVKAEARERMQGFAENFSKQVVAATDQVMQRLPDHHDIQEQAQLSLLDAQLSAKIWWLKMTASNEEHDDYKRKARDLLNKKVTEAQQAHRVRHGLQQLKADRYKPMKQTDIWSMIFRENRCRRDVRRGLKAPHQCEYLA